MVTETDGLRKGDDGVCRCAWSGDNRLYQHYHDNEWGRPVTDDVRLFEKIVLEGFQSGLSWLTILRKRENFRAAFSGFDLKKVAAFDDEDVTRLLEDAGIIRHGGKIRSAINNAQRALELQNEAGSLSKFFWSFEPPASERPETVTWDWIRNNPVSPTSKRLAKDLKKRGWSFVGPTTAYAFMQAMGLVNDHVEGCATRAKCESAHTAFRKSL